MLPGGLFLIVGFKDKFTQEIALGRCPRRFSVELVRSAQRKLAMIDAAVELNDLRSPPGNRLEALKGNRDGQHSIRINRQWRICFRWTQAGADAVEIVDYHS